MAMQDPLRQLQMLREFRERRPHDPSIRELIEQAANNARRSHSRIGSLVELWRELIPAEVEPHTSITALRGGTLHVAVDSAAMSYELDRLLRGGLEQELRRRYRGTLMRVRVKVAAAAEREQGGS